MWQSSLWRVDFINLLEHIARYDCVMLLVLLLHCLFPQYFVFIMPSVSIYQNTSGGAVPHMFVLLLHHAHSINMTV